ncbi:MAG: alkaline phosphatase [Pseudomonadota bacterium]
MKFPVLVAAGVSMLLAGSPVAAGAKDLASIPPPPPIPAASNTLKHIILFVGDGMGINTLTAARTYAVGEEGDLTLDTLPESAFIKTHSADMQVTDSAAAMSAYMTGLKTSNGVLAMSGCPASPAGPAAASVTRPGVDPAASATPAYAAVAQVRPIATLLELAKRGGWSAGVVNAGSVTDPLTAAGYAHNCLFARDEEIAAALVPGGAGYNGALAGGLDVVLGGGAPFFQRRADGRDLLAELRAQGYAQVADISALSAFKPAPGRRLVGIFNEGAPDAGANRDAGNAPTLAQMTTGAIDALATNERGFFLVVGNSLIGQALRASNARRGLEETVSLDKALTAAIDRMRAIDPGLKNTLLVMTASQDSTLILNGYAIRTGKTTATEPGVLGLARRYSDNKYYQDQEGKPYTIIGFGNGVNRVQGRRADAPALSDAIVSAPGYQQEAVLRMAPGTTTNGGIDVYLGAIGARAADFRGTLDNTQVHTLIKNAAGW